MSDDQTIQPDNEAASTGKAELLLPLVYDELHKLAAAQMARERPGQTLTATALVHEAFMRLADVKDSQEFSSQAHFFGAAAQAMRRILIEKARQKKAIKRGGDRRREVLPEEQLIAPAVCKQLIELDEALDRLAADDPHAAELVQLRYFAGLTVKEAAEVLGVSPRQADFLWSRAREFLGRELGDP